VLEMSPDRRVPKLLYVTLKTMLLSLTSKYNGSDGFSTVAPMRQPQAKALPVRTITVGMAWRRISLAKFWCACVVLVYPLEVTSAVVTFCSTEANPPTQSASG
jgi:hypothetical protein